MSSGSRHAALVASESKSVIAWHRERLRAAGFDHALAEQLADDGGIDLHAILGRIDRGCPPQLAARILAPLDTERRPP